MTDIEKTIEEAWPKSASANVMPLESWERLSGETSYAFAAFCVFRDFGMERNIRKAVEAGNKGEPDSFIAKRYLQWRQWAMKFHWRKRAADYDYYLEKLKQEELRKTIEAHGEKHREVTGKMLDVVKRKLDLMDPAKLTQRSVTKWVRTAIEAELKMAKMAANNDRPEVKQWELVFVSEFNGV
jgi:hypothetical protein